MFQRMDHGESVYAMIPAKAVTQPKPAMFKSKIPDYPPTCSTFHLPGTSHPHTSNMGGDALSHVVKPKNHAEFGRKLGSYKSDPNIFMKKMAKSSSVPSLLEIKRSNPDQLKPSHLKESRFAAMGGGGPPKRGEVPVMNLVTNKNFIVANAVETILAQPRKIKDNTKDYLSKEDYGKVPKYLTHIKKDIQAEYDYIGQLQEQAHAENQPPVQALDEEDRLNLLEGLKSNWEKVNTNYQAATHLTVLDCLGKVRRKEKYEAELAHIEKDIERLNNKNIHVHLAM